MPWALLWKILDLRRGLWVSLRGIEDVDDEGDDISDRLRVRGSVLSSRYVWFPAFDSALDLCWSLLIIYHKFSHM